jgi:hypothetical protein
LKIHFNIILPSTPGSSKWSPSLSCPHQNPIRTYLLVSYYVPYSPPISFFLIWSPEQYLVRSTDHKAPCYVVFSTTLLSILSKPQLSPLAPYFWTPSAYVPPSMWEKADLMQTNTWIHGHSSN